MRSPLHCLNKANELIGEAASGSGQTPTAESRVQQLEAFLRANGFADKI